MNEKRPFVFGVKKNTIYKFALLIVVSLLITFFGMSKIEAYYRKNVNTSVFFGTTEYTPLTFLLDKTIYPSGNNSSEVGLTINNSNNYNITYTLSFSNTNATYLVDGAPLTTYEVNANSGNAHVITINGATGTNITVSINVLLPYSVTHTKVINFDNVNPTANDIGGGTTLKTGSQGVTLKCSDNNSVTAYYFGTTEPTSASGINTTTSADLTALASSSGLSKTINAEGTYWLACKDVAGNFAKKSIVIRKYQVQNVLVKLGGSVTPYTSTNYELNGSASTYYVKNGTTLTLTSIYTIPAGGTASTFKGYTTSAPSTTAQTPSTTNSVVASNNTTTYYMWFDRTTRVLTYDFNTANNMNYWLYYMYQERFSISYDSNTKMSTLSVAGDSGWEIVYMPIATVSGKRYRVEFDYINPNGYSALSSSYGGIGVQALTTIANNDNLSNDLETIYLSTAQNNNAQHLNIEFTATGTNTYLAFNFGMAADGVINTVKLGNFKIVETLTHGASVSSIPSLSRTGYTFDGWYTATSEGTKLTTSTAINSDITYYAHDSQTSYTITYNLNGGSASNPGTYNVNTATITLNNPTRSGWTFLGWTGSNDLNTGTSQFTTSNPYVASERDHGIGNAFSVTSGNTYRIFVVAKRTAGAINMRGGIWYTEQTSGSAWDGYSQEFIEIESLGNGWSRYYKDVTVPAGKTKGRIYVQIDQYPAGYSTTWQVADVHAILGTNVTIPRGSTGDKTYNAYWYTQHILTINPNGGSYNSSTSNTTVIKYSGEAQTILNTPTKAGYIFNGWTFSGSGTYNPYDTSSTATSTATINYTSASSALPNVYNNSGNSNVTRSMVADSDATGGYALKITTNGAASPGTGGVYFDILPTTPGRINVVEVKAKIPYGYTLLDGGNGNMYTGVGGNYISPSLAETGRYRTFYLIYYMGDTGTITPTVYLHLNGSNNASVTWYLNTVTMRSYTKAQFKSLYTFGALNGTLTANWGTGGSSVVFDSNGGTFNTSNLGWSNANYYLSSTSITRFYIYNNAYGTHPGSSNYNWAPDTRITSRSGYTLDGWYTQASGGTKIFNADGTLVASVSGYSDADRKWIKYDSNVTLYAHWSSYTLTLRYNVNGGTITTGTGTERWRVSSSLVQRSTNSGSSWANATSVLNQGTTYLDLWNVGTYGATKTGYTINGTSAYNTKADGTGVDINQDNTATGQTNAVTVARINGGPLTSNKTIDIYIKWVETTATLTYNANGCGTAPSNVTMKYTTATNAASSMSMASGWIFTGWNTASGGNGTAYAAGAQVKAANVVPSALTLYAQCTKSTTYTASYNGNGNTGGSTSSTSCTSTARNGGSFPSCSVTLASNGFSKTGHDFSKWAEGSTSGTQRSPGTSVSLSSNKTFYAIWTASSYTLTLAGAYPIATSFDGQTVTLAGNVAVPSVASSALNLATGTSYTVSFDYVTSEVNNQFDVDFFPDGLPQYNPTATTSSQHLDWVTSSTDSRMSNCQLRFFDDFQGATEKDIVISNIMLSRNIVVTKTYGSTYGTLPAPSRTGYSFAGWYTAQTGGTQVSDSTQITGDTTWYARWTNNTTYHWRALCACYGNSTFSRWITGGGGSTNPSDATWQCMNSTGASTCSKFCQNNQGSYQGISSCTAEAD